MIPPRAERMGRWSGVCIILFSVLARVMTAPSRIPYWDIDPLTSWTPDTTRTPAMSLLFDALAWFAAALIVWAESQAGRGIAWRTGLLALIGCVGVFLHGWVLTPLVAIGGSPPTHGNFESMSLGSAWASAIIGAWALSMAGRDSAVRRFGAAMLLGAAVVLAAKGVMQVFVDHPRLVADFQQRAAELLAAQGFEPGSVSARLFERRLMQAEATGWFGLSNVYGSLMAAATAGLLALALGAMRGGSRGADRAVLWGAATAAALGLALSGSKGAIGAGFIGCALVISLWRRAPLRGWASWVMIALPVSAIAAVMLRGAIGERIGELSLYFRWQYLLAAARIIAAHPLFGVGPAGFKAQYLLFKEPTNPEEIDSPHSLPLDWLATLGVFGAAWVALWIVWLWRAGSGGAADPAASGGSVARRDGDSAAVAVPHHAPESECAAAPIAVIAVVMGFSLWCEWALYLPETLVVILAAAAGWWLAVRAALRTATDRAVGIALFSAAGALAVHCMIEVTGVWAGSAGWAMAMVGIAARARAGAPSPRIAWLAAISASIVGIALVMVSVQTFADEARLRLAASTARSAVSRDGGVDIKRLEEAKQLLEAGAPGRWTIGPRADAAEPRIRLGMHRAMLLSRDDPAAIDEFFADPIAEAGNLRTPRSASGWGRLGSILEAKAAVRHDEAALSAALDAWLRCAEHDPHSLPPAVRVARLMERLGRAEDAAVWADRALVIDEKLRLDPLKRLAGAQREEMMRISGGGRP